MDITVFERRDYIGGRLKHISYGPNKLKIEVGGAAWTDDNVYMTEMANAVGVNVTRKKLETKKSHSLFATASGNSIGVWDGSSLIGLEKFYFAHLGEALKVGKSELNFLKRVKRTMNPTVRCCTVSQLDQVSSKLPLLIAFTGTLSIF